MCGNRQRKTCLIKKIIYELIDRRIRYYTKRFIEKIIRAAKNLILSLAPEIGRTCYFPIISTERNRIYMNGQMCRTDVFKGDPKVMNLCHPLQPNLFYCSDHVERRFKMAVSYGKPRMLLVSFEFLFNMMQ